MSEFFEEVEFNISPSPGKPESPKVTWNKDKLQVALKEILSEISKIKGGTSKYTTYAINPGVFGFPAENAMKIFVENASDRTFKGIHDICRQDFGARAGDHFYELLKEAREENNG